MGHSSSTYNSSTVAEDVCPEVDVKNKIVVVTGANCGIGFETARVFAARGAHVTLACRSVERGNTAADELKKLTRSNKIDVLALDLGSFASIRAFAEAFQTRHAALHFLINNAGVILPAFETTPNGFEKGWATNHLGPFLLTTLLLPELRRGAPARVVNVSSGAHVAAREPFVASLPPAPSESVNYSTFGVYADGKLSNILFARELNTREAKNGITATSLHPGAIATDIGRHFSIAKVFYAVATPFLKSHAQGAATTMFCALSANAMPGGYHEDCQFKMPSRSEGTDDAACAALWTLSERLVASADQLPSADVQNQ
jgi:NAD(P)-dependent dehydrogenase (short-subunit alcohol dehydrogenase family)